MKVNTTFKRIASLCLSIILLLSSATPALAATNEKEVKRDIIAEIIASIDLTNGKVVKHLEDNMNPAMDEADEILGETEADVKNAIRFMEKVIVDAEARLEVGTDASADSYELLMDIVKTQSVAQETYTKAAADLETAKAELEAAQKAYDEAEAMSAKGKAEAEARLTAAKNAVAVAEKAFNEVNSKLVVLENLLANAAADTNAWKAEAQNALAAAGTHLNESNVALEEALAKVEIENAEFVANVEAFQAQSEVFTAAVNELAAAVEVAQSTEAELNRLYAEYEAVLVAYENAMAAFETEHGVSNLTYEDAVALMTALSEAITEAEKNVELAEVAVTDAQAVIEKVEADITATEGNIEAVTDEIKYLDALIANVASEDAEISAAAVHTLAGLVIKEYLANGLAVTEQAALSEIVEGSYGMSENGFYVVLNANGTVAARYGYLLENGVVNIYHMKSTDVTNYVTYNDTEYVLEENEGQYYIVVNGEVVNVYGNVASGYHVVETWMEDRADVYGHQVVSLTDQAPTALSVTVDLRGTIIADVVKYLGVNLEPITLDLASLSPDGNGAYVANIYEIVKIVVSKNEDATWIARVYYKSWGSYKDANISFQAPVSYPTKTQIFYDGVWYDLATADDGTLSIPVGETGTKIINVTARDGFGNPTQYAYLYQVECSADKYLVYTAGGAEDTFFELGDKVDVNSATLYALRVETLTKYNEELAEYVVALATAKANKETTDNNFTAAEEALLAAETKYENAQANFDALTVAYEAYAEKDLGSLAKLPRNISDFLTSANVDSLEDITALIEAISTLSNDKADAKDKLNAIVTLTQFIPMADIVIPENYESMNIIEWGKFLYNFVKTDLGKALLDPDSFQYEYFQAWLNALYAKVVS